MNSSVEEMLVALRTKIAALATSSVGPGDIHPGIISNIDEAIAALRTRRDAAGESVNPKRVASGLHRLVEYVSSPEWIMLASASISHDSTRMSMLKTYLFDLDQIAKIIEESEESPRTTSSNLPLEQPSQEEAAFKEKFALLKDLSERYVAIDEAFEEAWAQSPTEARLRVDPSSAMQAMIEYSRKKTESGTREKLEELDALALSVEKDLIGFGSQYVPAYVTALEIEVGKRKGRNWKFAGALIRMLSESGRDAASAVPILIKILKAKDGLGKRAAHALGAIGGSEAAECLKYVRDKGETIKERKFVFFSSKSIRYEFDSDLREAAIEALNKLAQT